MAKARSRNCLKALPGLSLRQAYSSGGLGQTKGHEDMRILPDLGPWVREWSDQSKALLAADPQPYHVSKDSFISREFMELENERLWRRVWQMACREQQVARTGDWVKYDVAGYSVLIVRSNSGVLKAYFNTCLHRGSPLKTEAEGNSREIRCRYHGWRWNLDGSSKEVTDAEDFDKNCISCERLALPECRVDTWGGWVFVNMDADAMPLLDFLGPIPKAMEHYELENRYLKRHRTTILPANWKTVMHAFTDGYHLQGTHPQALEFNDDTGWLYEIAGIHSYHIQPEGSSARPSARLGEFVPDKRTMFLASMASRAGLDVTTADDLEKLKKLADNIPDDMSITTFIANALRDERPGDEEYFSKFSDGQFEFENNPNWLLFPNVTTVQNAINSFWLRFRPHGSDPELMLFDVWSLERPAPGREVPPTPKSEFYEKHTDHDGWGGVLLQDIDNVTKVQRGMHNPSFKHLICGYQDMKLKHHDRVLRAYIAG
jgi:phenylpropionate dioxygenase-like ring-hydroxylating dioxygenase large terminal subunit